jgi:hypothetical protein
MSSLSEGEFDRIEAVDAMVVIETLAHGVDPTTGDVLPEGSPYNHPIVIRALFTSLKAMERLRRKGERRERRRRRKEERGQSLPENAGSPWSAEEDQRLIAAFDDGASLRTIAATHRRSEGAIAARLVRLGRISERSEARQPDRTRREHQ